MGSSRDFISPGMQGQDGVRGADKDKENPLFPAPALAVSQPQAVGSVKVL